MLTRLRVLPLLLASLALPGCLINSSSHVSYSGRHVSSDDLSRIEPGRTTEDRATELLGAPSCTRQLDGGARELRWDCTRTERSGSSVFLLFNSRNVTEKRESIVLKVKDGVVTDVRTE